MSSRFSFFFLFSFALANTGCPPKGGALIDTNDSGCEDADADGYTDENCGGDDCDDTKYAVNPGATEYCDEVDNDCDGTTDENDAADATTWYRDGDTDGFGQDDQILVSCKEPNHPEGTPAPYVSDSTDCDDTNASVNPDATEYCDGIDNDCDGLIDDADGSVVDASIWYEDADGDGYGNAEYTTMTCSAPDGYVSDSTDCDDTNASVNPNAAEVCDGIDNDCDGLADDADSSVSGEPTWYLDTDNDGYGNSTDSTEACAVPDGYATNNTDCDDTDAMFHPGASETDCSDPNDYNCDGSVAYADADSDGYAACNDCNDINAATNPDAAEVCDEVDNDCDGEIDEGAKIVYYLDADNDGYGNSTDSTEACAVPDGYATNNTDCDDTDHAYNPGAEEGCTDPNDYNCDGEVAYVDADGDGYAACNDCKDTDAEVNPGVTEACDEIDNDCDGEIDEGVKTVYYADADNDGYGDSTASIEVCAAPEGYVTNDTDCNDTDSAYNPGATEDDCTDPNDYNCDGEVAYADADGDGWAACEDCEDDDPGVHPGADEYCNEKDDDCDGATNESSAVDAKTWYQDADRDGYGNERISATSCSDLEGYVLVSSDCDDTKEAVYPGAIEVCDDLDNDCDGTTNEDDAMDAKTFYIDTDGDGYGVEGETTTSCDMKVSGYSSNYSDCDDTDASLNPGVTEVCDEIDNDCDGEIDEGVKTVYYFDGDSDEYGSDETSIAACAASEGYVANSGDCDDTDSAYNPGATEDDCTDPNDYNCDGEVAYVDADGDGYAACNDCKDTDPSVNPGVTTEICNGKDDNCDGYVDEEDPDVLGLECYYRDIDEDGFGDLGDEACVCFPIDGYVGGFEGFDCNDTNADVNPDAAEICDDLDNDCDEEIDEEMDCDADDDGYAADVDCDDSDPAVNPAAEETCTDGLDNDCDGQVDTLTVETVGYGDLVITEIMPNPSSHLDSGYEWLEVIVATECDVAIDGLVIYANSGSATISGTGVIASYEDLLILGIASTATSSTEDYNYGTTVMFSNTTDTVGLEGDLGTIDEVAYGSTYPVGSGYSMALDPSWIDADANDDGSYWCAGSGEYISGEEGTPGDTNDDCGIAPPPRPIPVFSR